MAKPLFKGSMIKMPGVPDENENKSYAAKKIEEMYPATPPLGVDDRAIFARQEFERNKLLEQQPEQTTMPASETDLQAYERLSKEAEEAAPTGEDVALAGVREGLAFQRAQSPEFLAKMAETQFYKPDAGKIPQIRLAEAQQPDVALTAKQQAQKRLQSLAESARKRALLPGELEEQKAKALDIRAKLTGNILSESRRKVAQGLVNSVLKSSKMPAIELPPDATEADVDRIIRAAKNEDTSTFKALQADYQNRSLTQRSEESARKRKEETTGRTVPGYGEALTEDDAKTLKKSLIAKENLVRGIDNIANQYSKLSLSDLKTNTEALQEIGQQSKDLVMQFKDKYGLGAPQAAELKFLYSLVEGDPTQVGTNLLTEQLTGATVQQKFNSLKKKLEDGMDTELRFRMREGVMPTATSREKGAGQTPAGTRKKTSASELP